MEENIFNECPHKCLWFSQCRCLTVCEYYDPIKDDDLTDEELLENKYNFREEFFEYLEENECCDN